jgi:glyoxylase-like metal-dependent hydrolase (beta-lactamase superfamily II)
MDMLQFAHSPIRLFSNQLITMQASRGVYPLSEGEFTIGYDKIFQPFDVENDDLLARPVGSLLVEVQPFLLITSEDVIVFDTGLGFTMADGTMQIHNNLQKHGISASDVTKVLMSHLHKDHAGGMLQTTSTGARVPSFPNAAYYIYKPEADYAVENAGKSYHLEDFQEILDSPLVVWLEGTEGRINEQITFRHSGGHCPQHIVFLVEDEGESWFFGGDEAPQLKQMKMKYIAKYDFDGKRALALREQYAEEGRRNDWSFLFYHDIKAPVAKLNTA